MHPPISLHYVALPTPHLNPQGFDCVNLDSDSATEKLLLPDNRLSAIFKAHAHYPTYLPVHSSVFLDCVSEFGVLGLVVQGLVSRSLVFQGFDWCFRDQCSRARCSRFRV